MSDGARRVSNEEQQIHLAFAIQGRYEYSQRVTRLNSYLEAIDDPKGEAYREICKK